MQGVVWGDPRLETLGSDALMGGIRAVVEGVVGNERSLHFGRDDGGVDGGGEFLCAF
jgi:hypothetical protein